MLGRSHFARRSHFALRIMGLALIMLPPVIVVEAAERHMLSFGTADGLMQPLVVLAFGAILVAGPVLFRDLSAPGASDDGGGGGSGPAEPPDVPGPSGGGIPLPDAQQARVRVRDHDRPDFRRTRPRRPAREPTRAPARIP